MNDRSWFLPENQTSLKSRNCKRLLRRTYCRQELVCLLLIQLSFVLGFVKACTDVEVGIITYFNKGLVCTRWGIVADLVKALYRVIVR